MLRALTLLLTTFAVGKAAACQLTMPAPLSSFDGSWYVLIGEVSEIVGPISSDDVVGGAHGVRVRIIERLHSPQPVVGLVDVFEYNLSAGCEALAIPRDQLERQYPPGTAVRIVARAVALLPAAARNAPPRLEGGPFNAHVLVAPIYAEEPVSASLARIYDFATPIDVARYDRIDAERFNWFWYEGMVEFELVKELLRLDRAVGDARRIPILRRVRHNPLRREIDFAGLVARYVEDPESAGALIAERH